MDFFPPPLLPLLSSSFLEFRPIQGRPLIDLRPTFVRPGTQRWIKYFHRARSTDLAPPTIKQYGAKAEIDETAERERPFDFHGGGGEIS